MVVLFTRVVVVVVVVAAAVVLLVVLLRVRAKTRAQSYHNDQQ